MVGLTDTPGLHYAMGYCISTTLYILLYKKNCRPMKLALNLGIMYAIIVSFMYLTDGVEKIYFVPCEMFSIMVLFITMKRTLGLSVAGAAYLCARAFILGEFATSVEWEFYYYFVNSMGMPYNFITGIGFLAVIFAIVIAVVGLIEKRIRDKNLGFELDITLRESGIAVGISIVVFIISNLSYVFSKGPFISNMSSEVFIIRTLVDSVGVALLIAYHLQVLENRTKSEVEMLQNMLSMQYNNYKISKDIIDLVNQKYHDLKHQIAILRSDISTGERLSCLDQLEEDIKAYEAQNKTGNKVLDIILTSKSIQCQNLGISLTCVADGSELGFMSSMDISTLFGNALDNAIESTRKIPEQEKRLIHLSVSREKNFLRIRIENCYEGHILVENGSIRTTKKDKRYHGYGLKSIENTAAKYGGSVKFQTEKGWFELRVLLPVPDKL